MSHRIVILGGGTGGTIMANRLRRAFAADEAEITVLDRDDRHIYQPGLLFVPFGLAAPDEIVRSRRAELHEGIEFVESEIDRVDLAEQRVRLADGTAAPYDVLIVASGCRLIPEETDGMTGTGSAPSRVSKTDRPQSPGRGTPRSTVGATTTCVIRRGSNRTRASWTRFRSSHTELSGGWVAMTISSAGNSRSASSIATWADK